MIRIGALLLAAPVFAQSYTEWMRTLANQALTARAGQISSINTVTKAEERKIILRQRILESIGGLPDYNGPLNATLVRTIDAGAYTIEVVRFESLPNFYVAANVYVPRGAGRKPAVLVQDGHDGDKSTLQVLCANLAIKGFVTLVFDPVGQGERVQGGNANEGTGQHFMAGAKAHLLGESLARYMIWDAKRAVDYLVSRADVDATRIGAAGCSGGGTLTAYLAALDNRIQAAASGCYFNTYQTSFDTALGDSEQSLHKFLANQFDFADWILLFAPKPYLLTATTGDFIPLAAAQAAYREGQAFYQIYGEPNRIQLSVDVGPHGFTTPQHEAIYAWMIRWLGGGIGSPAQQAIVEQSRGQLQVFSNPAAAGRKLHEILRDSFRAAAQQSSLRDWLRAAVSPVATMPRATPGIPFVRDGVNVEPITFTTEPGLDIAASLLTVGAAARRPGSIYVAEGSAIPAAAFPLARDGRAVLVVHVRGPGPDTSSLTGEWRDPTRGSLTGRELAAARAFDILRALDLLAARSDVDLQSLGAYAAGIPGVWLLMAAAIDTRISSIFLDATPLTFRQAFDQPDARWLHSALLFGFARSWDLPDLVALIGSRSISWTNPADWLGNTIADSALQPSLQAAITSSSYQSGILSVAVTLANTGQFDLVETQIALASIRKVGATLDEPTTTALPRILPLIRPGTSAPVSLVYQLRSAPARFTVSLTGSARGANASASAFAIRTAAANH